MPVTHTKNKNKNNKKNTIPSITEAVAVIKTDSGMAGNVVFKQTKSIVNITCDITGLPSNSQLGFHIHESGDLREGCKSCCSNRECRSSDRWPSRCRQWC